MRISLGRRMAHRICPADILTVARAGQRHGGADPAENAVGFLPLLETGQKKMNNQAVND